MPAAKLVARGAVPANDAVLTFVTRPLASTVTTGIAVEEPYVPTVPFTVVSVIGRTPPDTVPDASPDVDKFNATVIDSGPESAVS